MLLSLLATAGISFAKGLIEDHGEDLVKEGIKKVTGIDLEGKKELTSDEINTINSYKIQLEELDFKKLQLEYEARQKDETEKTKRWGSDNNSDSRIAKMTRPMLVLYLVFVCTLLALIDGNWGEFTIKDAWITLFTTLTITAVGGYFTLRTYEKKTGTNGWAK